MHSRSLQYIFSKLFLCFGAYTFPLIGIVLFRTYHTWHTEYVHLSHIKELTHWGRDKMTAISQTTFSSAFSWTKIFEFRLRFHWSLFPKGPIDNIPRLVQIMAWRRSGDKPLSEQVTESLLTYICITRPQWIKAHSHTQTKQNKLTILANFTAIQFYVFTRYMQSRPLLLTCKS